MRLGLNKRIRIRIFPAYTLPMWQSVNKVLVVCLVLTTFSMGFTYYYTRIRPFITNIAKQRSEQLVTLTINNIINEEMALTAVGYEDLMMVQRGEDDKIRALFMDTKEMNAIKSRLAVRLQEEIVKIERAQIKIPFGALLNSQIFSGMGPMINVELVPIGYMHVDFENSFSSAGINQTKHQIDIVINTSFGMILATGNENIEVKTSVPVAQTIIVGDVPESFLSFDKALPQMVQP